jgi:FlaA1/EpsC-like NDP-sugar epimerase
LKDKTVLVTGAGSLGRRLTMKLLDEDVRVVRVLDNSEQALFKLKLEVGQSERVRFLLGDVIDYDRVEFGMQGCNYVIHTCANKFVDLIEYNPFQAIYTNILGTINVIKAAMKVESVEKALFISTDKAVDPCSTYGMTKAIGERLFLWASRVSGKTFAIIRFPNFMPSDGSVFDVWEEQIARGEPLTITDRRMRRFFIPLDEAASLTVKALKMCMGGEIFIPKNVSEHTILSLAKKFGKEIKIIGRRPGERLREKLLSEEEKEKALETDEFWIVK